MTHNVQQGLPSTSSAKSDFISELLSIGEVYSQLREEKWISMINRGLASFANAHWNTFVRRTNRGIPQKYRWASWKVALKFDKYVSLVSSNYMSHASQSNEYTSIIQIDVPRTFPELKIFDVEAQQQLSRILLAYSNYHPEVGYCQGMNFIAGMLLLVSGFNELESYVGFVGLMKELGLAEFYKPTFPLIQKYIRAFDALMAEMWPDLHQHFEREEISVAVFLNQWFLTMFVIILPLRTVVALWDYILFNGLSSVLAVSLGLQYLLAPQMKQLKFEGIMTFSKHIKDADSKDDIRVGRIIVNQAYRISQSRGSLDDFISQQEALFTPRMESLGKIVTPSGPGSPRSNSTRSKPNPLASIVYQLGLVEPQGDELDLM
ncbi:GTPase activator [Babesia ovis]|uniref:GTPase activator n=1 Tax=Babesia ovis TaxID=5869 RepID=A0A9W5T9G1_BABOV|nr:GTPase activator [Babesia ovis]